mmetsp:Transcript_157271/g.501432  ORF Transcript_157271/g.501432 Transcript_157271/m.501432 type:complete len:80 (+) Transcript_157271:123-362(+)
MVDFALLRARGARNRSWAFLGVLSAWSFAALGFSACPRPLSGPLLPAPAWPTAVRAVGVKCTSLKALMMRKRSCWSLSA